MIAISELHFIIVDGFIFFSHFNHSSRISLRILTVYEDDQDSIEGLKPTVTLNEIKKVKCCFLKESFKHMHHRPVKDMKLM